MDLSARTVLPEGVPLPPLLHTLIARMQSQVRGSMGLTRPESEPCRALSPGHAALRCWQAPVKNDKPYTGTSPAMHV